MSVCVRHNSLAAVVVFCRNVYTDRADFRHGGIFRPVLRCIVRKFGYPQKQRLPVLPFVQLWTEKKIATARRSSAYRQRWTLSTINWTVVNWLKYFILATVYGVYHTDRPLRRRKAARRAGSSATADNCTINSLYFVCLWLATGSCDRPTLCALMG